MCDAMAGLHAASKILFVGGVPRRRERAAPS